MENEHRHFLLIKTNGSYVAYVGFNDESLPHVKRFLCEFEKAAQFGGINVRASLMFELMLLIYVFSP